MLWWMFTDPSGRAIFIDWEAEAAALLARFRAAADRHLDDVRFRELASRLRAASPEVREWWPRHEIAPLGWRTKRLRHPVLGELALRPVVLPVADDPDQKLITFDPVATRLASRRFSTVPRDRAPGHADGDPKRNVRPPRWRAPAASPVPTPRS
jgi:hypothetical protein